MLLCYLIWFAVRRRSQTDAASKKMAAVQGTAKSGGSYPEYVGAPLQFVELSTLFRDCYSLRGHSVQIPTQYMLAYTDIPTHAVYMQ